MILGIDPGKKGGLVVLDSAGKLSQKHAMPMIGKEVDFTRLGDLFKNWARPGRIDHAFMEKVGTNPIFSRAASFEFGRMVGVLEATLAYGGIPTTQVPPKVWQKAVHAGVTKEKDPKKRSLIAADRLFPGADFRASLSCRKPHDGIVDAALIAEYGRRTLMN